MGGYGSVKVFVVYDSKYGNTKLVAEKIVEGLKEVDGVETAIGYIKDVDVGEVAAAEAVLLGGPNHMGKPTRTLMKFVDKLSGAKRKTKWIAAFDTYIWREKNFGKAMRKLEKRMSEKFPDVKLLSPGLSIKVIGITGPIADGELPKCVEYGKKIGMELQKASA